MQFPSPTPPADGGTIGVVLWVAGMAVSVAGVLFWLRERSTSAQITDLKVEDGKKEVLIASLQKENRELRDARLADAVKQAESNKIIANRIMEYERAASERPGPMLEGDDWNIPTGVAQAIAVQPQRALPRPVVEQNVAPKRRHPSRSDR